MEDLFYAHNDIVHSHESQVQDFHWLKNKIADRSRQNNLKIRGVPESVTPKTCRTTYGAYCKCYFPPQRPKS